MCYFANMTHGEWRLELSNYLSSPLMRVWLDHTNTDYMPALLIYLDLLWKRSLAQLPLRRWFHVVHSFTKKFCVTFQHIWRHEKYLLWYVLEAYLCSCLYSWTQPKGNMNGEWNYIDIDQYPCFLFLLWGHMPTYCKHRELSSLLSKNADATFVKNSTRDSISLPGSEVPGRNSDIKFPYWLWLDSARGRFIRPLWCIL